MQPPKSYSVRGQCSLQASRSPARLQGSLVRDNTHDKRTLIPANGKTGPAAKSLLAELNVHRDSGLVCLLYTRPQSGADHMVLWRAQCFAETGGMSHWKEMKKEELEKQYSPSMWSHRMGKDEVITAHVTALSEGTKKAGSVAQTLLNVPYGEGDGEKLDIYLPVCPPQDLALVIYIHGGYWQFFSKEESGFMAPPLVSRGIAVVAVDYDIAPKGSMDVMVSQVRRSVASIVQQYSHISGVYLCGHSAGGQLAAMVLSSDWSQYKVTPNIKGAVLVSGIYDLLPIISTYVNDPLKMTEEDAVRSSPVLLVPMLKRWSAGCEVVVVVAEHDSPEFRRQSREYFQALECAGLKVSFEDLSNTDHFNVIEQLSDEDYHLTQVLLKMIRRTSVSHT